MFNRLLTVFERFALAFAFFTICILGVLVGSEIGRMHDTDEDDTTSVTSPVATPKPDVHKIIETVAKRYDLKKEWVHAVVSQESGYGAQKIGKAGEIGLMQIKCGTAMQMGFKGGCNDLFDPALNVEYGAKYLKHTMDKSGGFLCFGFTLYNAGANAKLHCSKYGKAVIARL